MQVTNVTADAETFTCNAFLVEGEVPTLIDAGAMAGVVNEIEARVGGLDQVVLTHQHGDHVAQLDAVLDAFDADLLAEGEHPRRTRGLADGDTITVGDESFKTISTPGHAGDHVSLVSGTTVFTGDVAVYSDGAFDDGSFGRTDMTGQSRERLIDSIRRLRDQLPAGVEHMYSGHGPDFHGDVAAVLTRALERAQRREPKYPDG